MERKTAIVTGSSSGFGLSVCLALAQEGYQVIATMRDTGKGSRLLAQAEQKGVLDRIALVSLDVTVPEQAEAVICQVISHYGRIDLLINNAGVAIGGFVEELPPEKWQEQFQTNFFGLVHVTRAVLPQMRKQRSGTIINLSSISGLIGFPGLAPYAASKHAVEGFSESLRLELLPWGIDVVLIEAGAYKTEIWEKGLRQVTANENSPYAPQMNRLRQIVTRIAEQAGPPEEVVHAIMTAVRAKRPRLRYPVGKGIRVQLLLKKLLPWSFLEKMIARQLDSRRDR